ncbi:hypothetical protein TNCV_257341 [Trichonephila clavipes]|nr:hypothetical protein TNCV_257341 [Trichonephila clavipes]
MWNTIVQVTFLVQPPSVVPVTILISVHYQPVDQHVEIRINPTISGKGPQLTTSSMISAHENFPSAPSTTRLPGGIFQKVRNSMQSHCQTCQTTSGSNFEYLLKYNNFIRSLMSH